MFKEMVSGNIWQKVAAVYDFRGRTTLMVASNDSIIEVDWSITHGSDQPRCVQRYEVEDSISMVQDLQVNSNVVVMQADDHYYFYRRDLLRVKYLLCVNQTHGSLCMLDQATPNAIIVGNNESISYLISIGYLAVR
jgi:hypothetical protein